MATTVGTSTITYNDNSVQGTAFVGSNMQIFQNPGTFTTPPGITKIKVTVFGGGGGGPGYGSSTTGGSGGAGTALLTVSGGTGYAITVGAGGNGGAYNGTVAPSTAQSGGTSSFSSLASATGGTGSAGNFQIGSFSTTGTSLGSAKLGGQNLAFGGGNPGTATPTGAGGGGMGGGGAGVPINTVTLSYGGNSFYSGAGGYGGPTFPGTPNTYVGGGPLGGQRGPIGTNGSKQTTGGGSGGGGGGVIVEW